MPRTTLDLDPSVLDELRRRGRRDGKSMGRVASELLAPLVNEHDSAPPKFKWITADLGTFAVDLEDKEALWDILDRDHDL